MSEVSLFTNPGTTVPSYIKNVQSNLAAATFAGGGAGKSISIRGGVFRMIVDGEEVRKSKERSMKFVIVGMSEAVGRVYYRGGYEEGKTEAPVCWSPDGKIPAIASSNLQSATCDECPKNIAGSGQGDSKACRYLRTLAVVLENDMGGDIYRISLPATSLFGKPEGNNMPLDAYRKLLKGHQLPIDCVVTEIEFDTDSSTPKLFFRPTRPLTEQEFHICQDRGKTEEALHAAKIEFAAAAKSKDASPPDRKAAPRADEPSLPDTFNQPVATAATTATMASGESVVVEEVSEPTKRTRTKPEPEVTSKPDVASVLDQWATDDDD